MSDGTLSVLSALQAVAFQWWRAEGEGPGAPSTSRPFRNG
jgi:hypothetical protein